MASIHSLAHTLYTTFAQLCALFAGTHSIAQRKHGAVMSGMVVFKSVREALSAGYHIYGKTEDGYLARMRTERGWALAMIVIAK